MKLQMNAKLCFIFLYGCAFVCQTYAAALTVERIPNEPEEHNFLEDNSETTIKEKSEKSTYETAHAVPVETNLDTVNEEKVTTEKSEDYTISSRAFTTEKTNLNTNSPSSTKAAVTDAPKTGRVTIHSVWHSRSKFRVCIDGNCMILDCNNSWEPMIFDPITKRCIRLYQAPMNPSIDHRYRPYPFGGRYY